MPACLLKLEEAIIVHDVHPAGFAVFRPIGCPRMARESGLHFGKCCILFATCSRSCTSEVFQWLFFLFVFVSCLQPSQSLAQKMKRPAKSIGGAKLREVPIAVASSFDISADSVRSLGYPRPFMFLSCMVDGCVLKNQAHFKLIF